MKASAFKTDSAQRGLSAKKEGKDNGRAKESQRRESEPLAELVQRMSWAGDRPSVEGLAEGLAAMPLAGRQSALRSLQRTVGNHFVQRLAIQAKLTVGAAGDRYEQEANQIADQVMRMTESPEHIQRQEDEEENEIQAKPLAASITPLVQRTATATPLSQQPDEDEEEVQTKRQDPLSSFLTSADWEQRLEASRGGGSSLPDDVRAYMEPRFGADFSGVCVHTSADAMAMSGQIHAQAFTHGQDIYMGAGQYAPGTTAGNRLLAHELAHTIQQGAAPVQRQGSPNAGEHVSQRHVDVTGAVSAIPTTQRPQQISLLNRSSFIQRNPPDPLNRDPQYKQETIRLLPGVSSVVDRYADNLRIFERTIRVLNVIKFRRSPFDPQIIEHHMRPLRNNLDQSVKDVFAEVRGLDLDETLSVLENKREILWEKAQLQDIPVDKYGRLRTRKLQDRRVVYDKTPEAKEKTHIEISGGHLKRSPNHDIAPNEDVDTGGSVTQFHGKGWEIFVAGDNSANDIHMASHKVGLYHHSSLLGGDSIMMGGEMQVRYGQIFAMTNKSGHYKPTPEHFLHFLLAIKEKVGLHFKITVMNADGNVIYEGPAVGWDLLKNKLNS